MAANTPIQITSYRNNSPRHGVTAFAIGILLIGIAAYFNPAADNSPGLFDVGPSGVRHTLQIFAALFFIIGLWILVRGQKRIVSIDAASRRIVIDDISRFGRNKRDIPFSAIDEVALDTWQDPDPDIRPFKRFEYWVAIHLVTGESVEITDRSGNMDEISRIRTDISAYIA